MLGLSKRADWRRQGQDLSFRSLQLTLERSKVEYQVADFPFRAPTQET